MIKWVFDCPTCGSRTTEKTSGSIRPNNWDKEVPKNIKCYYCESEMKAVDAFDSSAFMVMCNGPTKNLEKVKRT